MSSLKDSRKRLYSAKLKLAHKGLYCVSDMFSETGTWVPNWSMNMGRVGRSQNEVTPELSPEGSVRRGQGKGRKDIDSGTGDSMNKVMEVREREMRNQIAYACGTTSVCYC